MAQKLPWAAMRTDYISDPTLTLDDIASKYKCSTNSLYEKSAKEHWPDLRKNHQAELEKSALQTIITQTAEEKARVNNEHLIAADELIAKVKNLIHKGKESGDLKRDANAYLSLASALEKLQNIQRKALNLDDNVTPPVDVHVYLDALKTPEDIWEES